MKVRMLLIPANDDLVLPGGDAPADTSIELDPAPAGDDSTDQIPASKVGDEEEKLNLFDEDASKDEPALEIDVENIEYDLELGEESKIPEEEFDALVEEAKAQGLTKEEAEARLALMEKSYSSAEDLYVKTRSQQMKEELFQDEYFNSKEKRTESQEDIARALKEYKSPELVKLVKEDPFFRNNKTLMRLLVDMGRSLRPETLPSGRQEAAPKSEGNSASDMMRQYYPTMFEN